MKKDCTSERPFSLLRLMRIFGLCALILIVAFAVLMTDLNLDLGDYQNRMLSQFSASNDVIVGITELNDALSLYKNGWEECDFENYVAKTDALFASISRYMEMERSVIVSDTGNVNRLKNFNSYQLEKMEEAVPNLTAMYETVNYVQQALALHKDSLYRGFQEDISKGYTIYLEKEKAMRVKIMYLCYGLFFGLALLIGVFAYFSREVYAKISQMRKSLDAISRQQWNEGTLKEPTFKEFDLLFESINRMKDRLEASVNETREKNELQLELTSEKLRNERQQKMIVDTEMKMLKSQVNPHFLFNALHQIGMATLVESPEKVLRLVEATGKILRYSIRSRDMFVPLSEEMEIVENYVFLQNECRDVPVDVNFDIPLIAEDEQILPMCIQPLVENSFKHGFTKREKAYSLALKVSLDSNSVLVEIRDSGEGFDVHKYDDGGGIGIENIRKRLRLMYGRDDLMAVESRMGEYTSVSVRFPQKDEL
jgi:Putative regulator of cell autolysis